MWWMRRPPNVRCLLALACPQAFRSRQVSHRGVQASGIHFMTALRSFVSPTWSCLLGVVVLVSCTGRPSTAQTPGSCVPDRQGPPVERNRFAASDTSRYVLPFEPGTSRLVWRTTSHYVEGNGGVGLFAIDVAMPIGTPFIAARAGVVVAVRDSFADGNNTDLHENYVMIRHADSTIARYLHLMRGGALVKLGEPVAQGQRCPQRKLGPVDGTTPALRCTDLRTQPAAR